MTAFIAADDLRAYVTNGKAADENGLQLSADLACEVVVEACGPILTTEVVESLDAGTSAVLACADATITAVSVGVPADYKVSGQVLSRVDGAPFPELTVTYTAGAATAPAWARAAALLIASHHWRSRLSMPGQATVPVGFLVPNQAETLMAPHRLAPLGFA